MRFLLALVTCWLVALPGVAQIMVGPSDDLEGRLVGLSPGDEVVLEGGLYDVNERFSLVAMGTEAAPIVIRAADGERPHVRQNANQNIWDIQADHLIIRGIEFSGGSAGLRFESASNVTVEDCDVHDTSDAAIRFNQSGETYRNIRILRNHVHHTSGYGEGMYLGCNDDACRLVDSVIQGNYVHDTMGIQGDGIELKVGSYGNVIADNVIHDTGDGYPCLLGYTTAGNGAENIVERNVVWACGSHGIQWTADAIIRNNVVLFGADNGALSIQPNTGYQPRNLTIVHNTIVANGGDAIALRGVDGPVVVANNAVYAQSGRAIFTNGSHPRLVIAGNVGEGPTSGFSSGFSESTMSADLSGASYSGTLPNDVFPRAGGGLPGAGDTTYVTPGDFNGTAREGVADVGAYVLGDGTNPGWTFAEELKPPAGTPPRPGVDAGPPGEDAGVPPDSDGGMGPGPTEDGGPGRDVDGGANRGDGGADTGEGGGCSCRATRPSRSGPLALVFSLLLGVGLRSRRHRRRSTRRRPAAARR